MTYKNKISNKHNLLQTHDIIHHSYYI